MSSAFSQVLIAFIASAAVVCNADVITIRNSVLTVGIDTSRGGAISFLVDNNVPSLNLINCHDQGREVQQSYYAGPDPYDGAHWNGQPWPWNPISSGDVMGHSSAIIQLQHTASYIYVKARPLQWALNNVSCECTFETNITLDANGVYVRNRLLNARSDKSDYGTYDQELPAVYTIGQLSQLWSYEGGTPWSGGAVSQVSYPQPGPPWKSFTATENWAAFTNSAASHYGVGVHHAGVSSFLGGFHGTPGQGGSTDDNTGYIAPKGSRDIVWNDEYVWCFRLAIGYLNDIRSYFGQYRNDACTF